MPVTKKELITINKSADLWESFLDLPITHTGDINEFKFHIHAIQNIILFRSAYRVMHNIEEIKEIERPNTNTEIIL